MLRLMDYHHTTRQKEFVKGFGLGGQDHPRVIAKEKGRTRRIRQ